ncbi:MAG: hypothetical protein D6719_05860 [Candidatus Dadabacteria bacterium]|nr:MAG: hypothetical protein D6719_05860 [Candidatus Dadabacteria bacterium]
MNQYSENSPYSNRFTRELRIALYVASIFLLLIIYCWKGHLRTHELIYLIGPRKFLNPDFLANDITWAVRPQTTNLFDALIAPLWLFFDGFVIANIGRLLTWVLSAFALALLFFKLRLRWLAVVTGLILWLQFGQTIARCGLPYEGFQPKSLAYPLMFFSLYLALTERYYRAGLLAGLAVWFHVVVGGWSWFALGAAITLGSGHIRLGCLKKYLIISIPLVLISTIPVFVFHTSGGKAGAMSLIDKIYVTFAMPHCCDPDYFMDSKKWFMAAVVFVVLPLLLLIRKGRESKVLNVYVIALIVFWISGIVASYYQAYWYLKTYPFQLAVGLLPLFYFIFAVDNLIGAADKNRLHNLLRLLSLSLLLYVIDSENLIERAVHRPKLFMAEIEKYYQRGSVAYGEPAVYKWIRDNTPKNSVFITPVMQEFWMYAERAQLAQFRHPPLNYRIIEWKKRLEGINKFKEFDKRGYRIAKGLNWNESRLTESELIRLGKLYGATHYLSRVRRKDLKEYELYSGLTMFVYRVPERSG